MHAMLEEHFGFDDFTILIDTDPSSEQPTGANIKVNSSNNTSSSSSSSGVDSLVTSIPCSSSGVVVVPLLHVRCINWI